MSDTDDVLKELSAWSEGRSQVVRGRARPLRQAINP